jgi:hypothetical protein
MAQGNDEHVESTVNLLSEARARAKVLADSLPVVVDPASISLRAKIPFKALCFREGLIWRTEELARSACDAFDRGDDVAGITLARSVTECAAACWYLHRLIAKHIDRPIDKAELNRKIEALLLGSKRDDDEMPEAVNVLTFLQQVDNTIPGVLRSYQNMSEYAHPNWGGTAIAYSRNDHEKILTHFGKRMRDNPDMHSHLGLKALNGSLIMFEYAYNKISDQMPAFIAQCEADLEDRKIDSAARLQPPTTAEPHVARQIALPAVGSAPQLKAHHQDDSECARSPSQRSPAGSGSKV